MSLYADSVIYRKAIILFLGIPLSSNLSLILHQAKFHGLLVKSGLTKDFVTLGEVIAILYFELPSLDNFLMILILGAELPR